LVEDLVTTGGSSIAAIEALRAEGAMVSDCLAIISYGFPEAVELFKNAGIRLHAATTFQAVLQSALQSKMIDEAGAAVVRDWLQEPRTWAKRHGFE
jgi:orotate phosphoribosyltransferase